MFGHWVGSFIVIVSGCCVITYCIQVSQESLCGNSNLIVEARDYVFNRPDSSKNMERSFEFNTTSTKLKEQTAISASRSSSTSYSRPRQYSDDRWNEISSVLAILKEKCPEKQREIYYQWHFLSAGVNIIGLIIIIQFF